MHTSAERRRVSPTRAGRGSMARSGGVQARSVPNSAMASMMGRSSGVSMRQQAQIPQAENEADRLSASIRGGSPESVKADMGRRMGADFSGVRFHTGSAAAAKADAMGARAFTSGTDVYFGSGGFDASIAAHELVHTTQQGMVDSGVSTMSTPVGGVQMWPWSKKKG